MDGDHLCCDCDGTGWVLYRSETDDGGFEEAYRLCPKGHAPRYCMGSSSGHLCLRPATKRCGSGYYCKEHIAVIHDGRDLDDPCEAIQRPCGPEASGYRSPQEVALYVEADVPSKLSGCETTLERGLYKALHELQRLQVARRADGNA